MVARWYLLQASSYATANLQRVYWYAWGAKGATQGWGTIEDSTGVPTQAGKAYEQVEDWLVGATISAPCSSSLDSTWTCGLSRGNGYQGLVVWNTARTISSYTSASQYTQYRDLEGHVVPVPNSGTIMIGAKPILLETGNPQ